MDWQSVVIIFVIIIALFWILFRLKGNIRNPSKLQITVGLITSIDEALKTIHQRKTNPNTVNKFKLSGWKYNIEHLDFLDAETVKAIKDSYALLTEYNAKIDEAAITPGATPPDLLSESTWDLLVKSRTGLSAWTRDNITRETVRGTFTWR